MYHLCAANYNLFCVFVESIDKIVIINMDFYYYSWHGGPLIVTKKLFHSYKRCIFLKLQNNCAILKKHNIFQHNSEKSIQSINITSEADV